jgi:hypothetical protein
MAWWREHLEELDRKTKPANEPRLRRVQDELVGRGVSGSKLSNLENAWLPLLEPFPWGEQVAEGLRKRGRLLFGIGACLLGGEHHDAAAAGAVWSLVDGATHCSDAESRDYLVAAARTALSDLPQNPSRQVRTLTILAALAAYDLQPGGRLGRVGLALAHRLRGSMPRS